MPSLLGRTLERRVRLAVALTHYRLAVVMVAESEYRDRLEVAQARLPATGRQDDG